MRMPKAAAQKYIECVLPEVAGHFHYTLPTALSKQAFEPGSRLLVPFGKAWKIAFFTRKIQKPDVPKTRVILALLDPHSLIQPPLFKLLCWISDYYMSPLGGVLKAALPQGIHALPRRSFRRLKGSAEIEARIRSASQKQILSLLEEYESLSEQDLRKYLQRAGLNRYLSALKQKGLIEEVWSLAAPSVRPKLQSFIALKDADKPDEAVLALLKRRAPKQFDLLEKLRASGDRLALSELDAPAKSALTRLLEKDLVVRQQEAVLRPPQRAEGFRNKGEIELNADQKAVLDPLLKALSRRRFAPFLLHGVTGSGKTEVYLRAVEACLKSGKGAILLLPEIGLTAHIAARFQERFGSKVALLHSGLSPGERHDEWQRLRQGEAKLAIGARSAIFAPLKSLGLIIVDEEHDPSYRQEEGSRYHGRDVALVRARDASAVVLLGSATPSFESYFHAKKGKYGYLHLPNRVDARAMPKVRLVDLKDKSLWVRPFFTRPLYLAIKKRLAAKEQCLLFVNRRGFSPFLLCYDCGFIPACTQCSVSLTFHKGLRTLICHYCGHQEAPPSTCPKCLGTNVANIGIGTEQIEETIRLLYPDARIARLDRDTTQKKGASRQILGAMAREEIDILIGTQMIAKGHDFPQVTLVGVLSADQSLHLPDFRSSERTFQLLAQVAGRAGRGERPGEVIVQSFQPEDVAIQAAVSHDYPGFFEKMLPLRQERGYPPYSRLLLLLLSHPQEETLSEGAGLLAGLIKAQIKGKDIQLLGPAPAPLLRLKQAYRYQILLKGADQRQMAVALKPAVARWRKKVKGGIRLSPEVDPQHFS